MPRFKNQAGTALLLAATRVFCIVGLSNSASAQEARPLSVEDAVKLHYFGDSSLQFSPDGERLAYVLRDNQKKNNPKYREAQVRKRRPVARDRRRHLHRCEKRTGESGKRYGRPS